MRLIALALGGIASLSLVPAASASAETREQYLARLAEICEVECLQPLQFQRAARKRGSDQAQDMALIMDVKSIRRVGDKIQLNNISIEISHFEIIEAFGSAGIDTSQRTGIGGLPSGRIERINPNIVAIEIDQQTLFDLLNPVLPEDVRAAAQTEMGDIVVDGRRDRKFKAPTLAALETAILNRRIVVRGTPRLEVGLIGARRDFRRKQAILEVDNAAEMVLLPRYDKNGEAINGGEFEIVAAR
jgi:hypothetical protein